MQTVANQGNPPELWFQNFYWGSQSQRYKVPAWLSLVLEKEMATHSSVLAWRIPGMGEPGGLPSMGSHRVRHDWRDLAAAHWTELNWAHICNSYAFLDELTFFSFFLLIFGISPVLMSVFSDINIAFLYYLQGIFFQYFYFQHFSD